MIVKTIPVGQLESNCYIIADEETSRALVIDPGDEPDRIIDELSGLDVDFIVLTHAHFDHAGAVGELKEATGAKIVIHEDEGGHYAAIKDQGAFWGFSLPDLPEPDTLIKDGDELVLGSLTFTAIHTPGHTGDHFCLHDPETGVFLAGDHVLPSITPHISGISSSPDPLSSFFFSLDRVAEMSGVGQVLPAHGHPFDDRHVGGRGQSRRSGDLRPQRSAGRLAGPL